MNTTKFGELDQTIRESEEIYRNLFEESASMNALMNLKGYIIDINSKITKNLGYNSDDLLGHNINALLTNVPEENSPLITSKFKEILFKGSIEPIEVQIFDNNRNLKWIIAQASLVRLKKEILILIIMQDITEKKEAEEKLKESEERYRLIIENTNDLIAIFNQNFEHEYINENAYFNLLGYKNDEIIGKRPKEFRHPDDLERASKAIKKGLKSGETNDDFRIKHKDGHFIWVETKGKFFKDRTGKLKSIFISRDIDKRTKAEQKLRESEEKFRTIAEQSLMGIAIFQDDLIKYVNKRLAELFGYSVNDILNWKEREFFKTIPFDMKKKIIQLAQMLKNDSERSLFSYQSKGIKRSGEMIWLDIYLKPIKYLEKFAYLATFIDITEQKKTEQKLKESEEKYRNLFNNSAYAIILADRKGDVIDCNLACKQLFSSIANDENNNKNFKNLFSNLKNYKEALYIFNQKYEKLFKEDITDKFEIELIKADNKRIWLNFRASLIKIDEELMIQMIIQDITDKKDAERIILEENKRLSEINQMKNEIVSRVSHELKTPLNSIYGAAQVLLNLYKDQINPEVLEFVEMIDKGGNRLKLLIENLLDISKLESNKISLFKTNENLVEIIKECVENIRYLANNRNLILNLELPSEAFIDIDKIRIEQVITNLLSNAIKNTLPLGKISIGLKNEKDWVEFSIHDTGIGFTKKELEENLFKKFGKIERYGQNLNVDIEGSGLGLYISKEIIDLHGGNINVRSDGRNKGSIFIVKLFK